MEVKQLTLTQPMGPKMKSQGNLENYQETNENKNTIHQYLCNAAKTVLHLTLTINKDLELTT